MDLFRHLIWFFVKIAIAFFTVAIVWWIISAFFPAINFRTFLPVTFLNGEYSTSTKREDILPSPRQFSSFFGGYIVPTATSNVYVAKPANSGYGALNTQYKYTTYSYSQYNPLNGENIGGDYTNVSTDPNVYSYQKNDQVITNRPENVSSTNNRNLFIRNLSIYEGNPIYSGLNFIGEARSVMFKNGVFPIVLVDASRRVIGVTAARAVSEWSVPGWVRFEAKIAYDLPKSSPCTVIFEQALTSQEKVSGRVPVIVPVNVVCR